MKLLQTWESLHVYASGSTEIYPGELTANRSLKSEVYNRGYAHKIPTQYT